MIKKSRLIGSALLLLAVLAAPDAQALSPIRFGVKAGIQTQSLKMQGMNWNELSKSNNFGYQLGVMAQVPLGPVYLQPEIFYSSARFKLQGDLTQIDLARKADSGLSTVMKLLQGIDGIGMVEFDNRDIIRHRLVKYIVEAFDNQSKASEPELFAQDNNPERSN